MKTAVQNRRDKDIVSYTIYGNPFTTKTGSFGDIALYENGKIIIFVISKLHIKKAFIFKTNPVAGTHKIPGVYPEVILLAQTRTRMKTNKLQKYLEYIRKENIDLDSFPEEFFIRFNTLMEERSNARDFYNLLRRYTP
jgi:hypothetical protein